ESASCSENINNLKTDDNVHNNTLEIAINISHSICQCNTTRIHNKCHTYTKDPQALGGRKENDLTLVVKRLLEELFLKKVCSWNPKEFTNMAVEKKLCLDDNLIENRVKLYRWISNRKIHAKNINNVNT
ncbi:5918_t:CDS:2, partial [Cetraspora pellucida]